jgi:hypothetical protein
MSTLKKIKKKLYPIISRYIANATLVEGALKETGKPFRCLFVENAKYQRSIAARIYTASPRILKKWKIFIPDLKRVLRKYSTSIDLCVSILPTNYGSYFNRLCAFKGQKFVRQVIDTSGTWEEIFKGFHKKKRQYSNNVEGKFGLSYMISHDINDFELFYYRMHLPHIRNQFDDFAVIDSYEDMKKFFLKGFLLLVVADGQKIAGALCLKENNNLIFRRSGVLDGNEEYRKKGAQFALYYFNIRYAWEQEIKKVDTMVSVSFLNNVYRTKREWGASVHPDDEAESIVFYFIPNYTPEIAYIFGQNPVIVCEEDGLYVLTGWQGSLNLTMTEKKELFNKYYSPGLNGVILLTPNDEEKKKVMFEEFGTIGL